MPPRFRVEHIGSLIRPSSLLAARSSADAALTAAAGGPDHSHSHSPATQASPSEAKSNLASMQASAIASVVSRQLSLGVPITTGEFERWVFCADFFNTLSGIELRPANMTTDVRPGLPQAKPHLLGPKTFPLEVAVSKIRWTRSAYMDSWLQLRSLLPEDRWKDAKITVPPPEWFHVARKAGTAADPGVYGSDEELLRDCGIAVLSELMALYEAGLRVAQIDAPDLTYFCDTEFLEDLKGAGTDADELLGLYIRTLNSVVEGLPADFQVGIHLCRGNFPGAQFCVTGGYERIAERLLRELKFGVYYLEFDSERAGDLEPLRVLPREKVVVLGVVTTKYAEMEDVAVLKGRVMKAAEVIAAGQGRTKEEVVRDCLAVSPQCGFASVNFGKGVGFDEEVQWKKLELLKKLAHEIWPDEV